jgi:hypothetical protein
MIIFPCGNRASEGFVTDTPCGTSLTNNYRVCQTCPSANTAANTFLTARTMACR